MPLPVNPPAGPVTLSANARTVLQKRYLVKNEKGQPVEQPEDLFWRVATVVAEADRRYGASDEAVKQRAEDFYFLMTQRRFEPNSPTLMNAGRPLGQLSACFVLPVGERVFDGQNETRAELAQRTSRVHEGWRVRLEAPIGHESVELARRLLDRPIARAVSTIRLGNDGRDTPEEILGLLHGLALLVLHQIALLEHGARIW